MSDVGAAACLQHTSAVWPPRKAFQGILPQSTPGKNYVGRIAVVNLALKAAIPPLSTAEPYLQILFSGAWYLWLSLWQPKGTSWELVAAQLLDKNGSVSECRWFGGIFVGQRCTTFKLLWYLLSEDVGICPYQGASMTEAMCSWPLTFLYTIMGPCWPINKLSQPSWVIYDKF